MSRQVLQKVTENHQTCNRKPFITSRRSNRSATERILNCCGGSTKLWQKVPQRVMDIIPKCYGKPSKKLRKIHQHAMRSFQHATERPQHTMESPPNNITQSSQTCHEKPQQCHGRSSKWMGCVCIGVCLGVRGGWGSICVCVCACMPVGV